MPAAVAVSLRTSVDGPHSDLGVLPRDKLIVVEAIIMPSPPAAAAAFPDPPPPPPPSKGRETSPSVYRRRRFSALHSATDAAAAAAAADICPLRGDRLCCHCWLLLLLPCGPPVKYEGVPRMLGDPLPASPPPTPPPREGRNGRALE